MPWTLDKVWDALAASRQDATGGDVDLCGQYHRDRRVTWAGVADGSTAVLGLECVVLAKVMQPLVAVWVAVECRPAPAGDGEGDGDGGGFEN